NQTPKINPWIIAIAVILPTFIEVLDTTVVSVALNTIAGNLGSTVSQATWIQTGYLISNAIVLPTTAWFSAKFGRKRFLLACIGIFTLASFACGAAPNLPFLIFASIVQGAGGGALQPISQAILMVQQFIFDPEYIRNLKPARLDAFGFLVLGIWLGTMQTVLNKGQDEDWFNSSYICWLSVISAVAFIAFVVRHFRA